MITLLIQYLIDDSCELQFVDNYAYDPAIINGLTARTIELCFSKNSSKNTAFHANKFDIYNTSFSQSGNGIFEYHKLVIMDYSFYPSGVITTTGELFYYMDSVYKSNSNTYLSVLDLVNDSILITTADELLKYYDKSFAYGTLSDIINLCELEKCLYNLQKKYFELILSSQCADEIVQLKKDLDFITISLSIVNRMIDTGDLFEAQRLLDTLKMCNSICKDMLNPINSNCGCGSSR